MYCEIVVDRLNEISIFNKLQLILYVFDFRYLYYDCSLLMLISKIDYVLDLF